MLVHDHLSLFTCVNNLVNSKNCVKRVCEDTIFFLCDFKNDLLACI